MAGAKFAVIDDEAGTPVPDVMSGTGRPVRLRDAAPYPQGIVRNPRQVVASAPGFGLDWISEPREDAVFRLVPDQPIAGRVIDLQGKPVAGATVAVHDVHAGPPAAFDELVKNWKKSDKGTGRGGRASSTGRSGTAAAWAGRSTPRRPPTGRSRSPGSGRTGSSPCSSPGPGSPTPTPTSPRGPGSTQPAAPRTPNRLHPAEVRSRRAVRTSRSPASSATRTPAARWPGCA